MALSPEQEAFLSHPPTESARLLAGPGTGKSFTSVAYLEKVAADYSDIRVGYITFTRAATAEFAKKLDDAGLTALGGHPPRTMHGFALGILLQHHSSRIPYPLRIPDSWETEHLIHPDICRLLRAKGFTKVTPRLVKTLEEELAANFESLGGRQLPIASEQPELVSAYKGVWRDHRQRYGYTLLSELPYQAAGVLADMDESDLGVDLVIVDEFQDLNKADQNVLSQLAARGVSIIAIGDDDQSIYSWRNADPTGIRTFCTTFTTTYDYPLSVSQRCGGRALEIANQLIEQDPGRPRKTRLVSSDRAPDTDIHYYRFRSNMGEAKGVAKLVAQRLAEGVDPTEIAVLVRSSIDIWVRELQPAFEELGLPMAPPANAKTVLADRGVRTALALGQLLQNQNDSLAWRALVTVTPGIGDASVDAIYAHDTAASFAESLLALHETKFEGIRNAGRLDTAVSEILATLEQARDTDPPEEGDGWAGWLADLVGRDKFDESALTLFLAVGAQAGTDQGIASFLGEFEPSLRELATSANDGVRIMTMGMSKGLTVNTAIVMGVDSGNIPSPRGERAEELRLLYVALTRATDLSVVTYANRRKGATARVGDPRVWDQREQSPFMTDLDGLPLEMGDDL